MSRPEEEEEELRGHTRTHTRAGRPHTHTHTHAKQINLLLACLLGPTHQVSPLAVPMLLSNLISGAIALEVGAKGPNYGNTNTTRPIHPVHYE